MIALLLVMLGFTVWASVHDLRRQRLERVEAADVAAYDEWVAVLRTVMV